MSYLLFLDESGHDRKTTPYEVLGGIALHAEKLWPFIQAMRSIEEAAFGNVLQRYGTEIKGHTLLDKDRFRWAMQGDLLDETERRRYAASFLNKGVQKSPPRRIEFTAYGQACLLLARGIFKVLRDHEAVLLAAIIPGTARRPETYEAAEVLGKDHVLLLERYFYLLEREGEPGLIVMDETDKALDRRFVRRLQRYFTLTKAGRYRAARVVPAPLFVSSDMSYPIQAADVCIYCINWGFRLPSQSMDAPTRAEIGEEFGPRLSELQFQCDAHEDGLVHQIYGIVYVPEPYGPGAQGKRRQGFRGGRSGP